MANSMQKMTATWTGFPGAPGTTSLFLGGGSIASPALLKDFFTAFLPYIPATVQIQVQGSGELVNPTDGKVVGTWQQTLPPILTGSAAGAVLNVASGAQMKLDTGQFRRGKHIVGRIYLVPSSSSLIASTGTIATAAKTALDAAAQTFATQLGGNLGVWHRPVYDRTVKPPVLKEPGEWINSLTMVTASKVVVLRSRRD